MRGLMLLCFVAASACAHVEPEPEVIAWNPPIEPMTTAMRGGVPVVDGTIYNGMQSMPEVVSRNAATTPMSTTKFEPFVPLVGAQRTEKYIQIVTVINRDATGSVCVYLESWSQDCASAVAFTCEGASLQALTTPPGGARTFRVSGLNKVCANASEANVHGQLERTVLYAR